MGFFGYISDKVYLIIAVSDVALGFTVQAHRDTGHQNSKNAHVQGKKKQCSMLFTPIFDRFSSCVAPE